ncbi:MAG: hypothetical protein OXI26_00380 [bacterium]|nr:hypothetical protein [bacterium]
MGIATISPEGRRETRTGRDEFGGFCRLDWLRYPLEIDDLPPPDDDQFRDAGCEEPIRHDVRVVSALLSGT